MKIDSISINGKITAFEISEKIFSSDINNKLIGQVLYSQIANFKPRLAKTKQRNEITGSTAKIYAQKGTGKARHASRKAPIFVGGGVAHGPKGNVYKVRKINKKEKRGKKGTPNGSQKSADFVVRVRPTNVGGRFTSPLPPSQ